MIRIVVEVTAEDIAEGMRGSAGWNPIARAMDRSLGQHVYAEYGHAYLSPWGNRIELPAIAKAFLLAFQSGLTVSPIVFEIEVPDHWIIKGAA